MKVVFLFLLLLMGSIGAHAQYCPCNNLRPSTSGLCPPCEDSPQCPPWQTIPSNVWSTMGDVGICSDGWSHRMIQPQPNLKYRICNGTVDLCLTGTLWMFGYLERCELALPPCPEDPRLGLNIVLQLLERMGAISYWSYRCPTSLRVNLYTCVACGQQQGCGAKRCHSTFDVCVPDSVVDYDQCYCTEPTSTTAKAVPLIYTYIGTTSLYECPIPGAPCSTIGCSQLDAWLRCYFP